METISAEEAKNRLVELISTMTKERTRYKVTTEEGTIILLPEETYENILVTLEVLSTPGLLDGLNAAAPLL